MTFSLRHLFIVLTAAAMLLWVLLWARWDARECVYLSILFAAVGLVISIPRMTIRAKCVRLPIAVGVGAWCASIAEMHWFVKFPKFGNESELALLVAGQCVLAGIVAIAGGLAAVIELDSRHGILSRFTWWRRIGLMSWRRGLQNEAIVACIGAMVVGATWAILPETLRYSILGGLFMALTLVALYLAFVAVHGAAAEAWTTVANWRNGSTKRCRGLVAVVAILLIALVYVRLRPTSPWTKRTLPGRTTRMAISADGSLFALYVDQAWQNVPGMSLDDLAIFDWKTAQPTVILGKRSLCAELTFLGDSRELLFGEGAARGAFWQTPLKRLVVIDGTNGNELRQSTDVKSFSPLFRFITSDDGTRALVATPEPGASLDNGPYTVTEINVRDFTHNFTTLVTPSADFRGITWDANQNSTLETFVRERERGIRITPLEPNSNRQPRESKSGGSWPFISPDGKWLIDGPTLTNLVSGKQKRIDATTEWNAKFTSDNRRVVIPHRHEGMSRRLRGIMNSLPLWRQLPPIGAYSLRIMDVESSKLVSEIGDWNAHDYFVMSADGTRIVVESYDNYLDTVGVVLWEFRQSDESH